MTSIPKSRQPAYMYFLLMMVLSAPGLASSLQFDGVYQSDPKRDQDGNYWGYFRFYEDGTVISVTTSGTSENIKYWFTREDERFGSGKYTLEDGKISFITESEFARVEYNGSLDNEFIDLDIYSHTTNYKSNRRYRFIPVYRAREKPDTYEICRAQESLTRLGLDPGPVDGLAGKATKSAIAAYRDKFMPELNVDNYLELLQSLSATVGAISADAGAFDNYRLRKPANGEVLDGRNTRAIAPLKIKTSTGADFFVKLESVSDQSTLKSVFIEGGSSVSIKMPLGKATMKYATGDIWFGKNCLFGMSTDYSRADAILDFYRQGNRVSGYEVELILQQGGNLPTTSIDGSDW